MERELKYGLNRSHYQKLVRSVRRTPKKIQRQRNFYFDDPLLHLRRKRFGLRVRLVNGKFAFITLKYPAMAPRNAPKMLKVRHEHEVQIPVSLARKLIKGQKPISDVPVKPIRILKRAFPASILVKVKPLGRIDTHRTIAPLDGHFDLEMDRFTMFGRQFYELEVETHKDPHRTDLIVQALFILLKIPYSPITQSKLSRFIQLWKRRQ